MITIIVLLILAGVAIYQLTNNNILDNAQSAVDRYNDKAGQEDELITQLDELLNQYAVKETDATYFSYTVANNEATITGFSPEGQAKYDAGELTELVFPTKNPDDMLITTIGISSFYNKDKIKSVIFKDNITLINHNAFGDCHSLQTVKFLQNGITFGQAVFSNCKELNNVIIPDGVESLTYGFFGGCIKLNNIYIPDNLKTIDREAFAACYKITKFKMPNEINNIGKEIFKDCNEVNSISYKGTEYKKIQLLKNALIANNVNLDDDSFKDFKLGEDD